MKRTGMRIMVAALLAVLLAAGCGDGDEPDEGPAAAYKVLGGRLVWCAGTVESITVPESAFSGWTGLTSVNYDGTMAEWNAIKAPSSNSTGLSGKTIICTDGSLTQ